MNDHNQGAEADPRDGMAVPDLVMEQWRIQVCHIARISYARRVLVAGKVSNGYRVYAAGKPGKPLVRIPDISRMLPPDPSVPVQEFLLRTKVWFHPLVRCRSIPLLWPDGRTFGALLFLSPPFRANPPMEDSFRFMIEETLRLGLHTVKSKAEAGFERTMLDPLHRELFSKMVCRCMGDKNIALLSISADNGDQLREECGREFEMRVMAVLARRLMYRVRGTDLVCRLEDGRFLALMRQADSLQRAVAFTQKLLMAAREDIHFPDRQISVRVSIGVAFNNESVQDYDQLLRQAQAAMYQARRTGGDRFVVYNPEMQQPY